MLHTHRQFSLHNTRRKVFLRKQGLSRHPFCRNRAFGPRYTLDVHLRLLARDERKGDSTLQLKCLTKLFASNSAVRIADDADQVL